VEDLSLHIMDLVDNSIAARASRVHVAIREDRKNERLHILIEDDGEGMDPQTLESAQDPFFSTKNGKPFGLGLSLFAQAARESGGHMEVESRPQGGTRIRAEFDLGHPDRKPLGDVEKTMILLQASHPEIEFSLDWDTEPDGGAL
jgi:signal transduction histidine kinase